MDAWLRLIALATTQHGAFTRRQALECGMTGPMLSRRLRNGSLTRIYEGTFVISGSAHTWERALSVAVLSSGTGAVASHHTALHLHGLAKRPSRIEVSITTKGVPTREHVVHRTTDLVPGDVTSVNGVACTTIARSLVDAGIPWGEGLVARCLDEAIRRGLVDLQAVAAVFHRVARRGRNGAGPMRAVLLDHIGIITESVMENEFFRLMHVAGIDLPEPQVNVHRRGGRFIARVDCLFHPVKLVIALDGEAYHSDRTSFRLDRRQQNQMVLEGYTFLRFTYFDIFAAPEMVVAQVVAALGRLAAKPAS